MKENEKNQVQVIQLPPPWCGAICMNAISEKCITQCAIKRDCSSFKLKRMDLSDMPRFPVDQVQDMTKEEKFIIVTAYLGKVIDHLQGHSDEPTYRPLARRNPNPQRSSQIPENIQVENLLYVAKEAITPLSAVQKREGTEERSSRVDQPAD